MSRKYFPPKCSYDIVGSHIETNKSYRSKLSGTMLGGVLGCSPYTTPFQVACNLLGLCREDISSKPAVKVGSYLESRIIRYARETYPEYGLFVDADKMYAKREGDHAAWVSDFEDDVFAGHVDGIVMGTDEVNRILEIKTSGNVAAWEKGVPEHYYWQVALYNHFITKQDYALVVLGVVDEYTYRNVDGWVPNENTVMLFKMDIDRDKVEEGIKKAKDWYDTYIRNGITPDYDPTNPGDVEMYEHLVGLSQDVTVLQRELDEYAQLDNELKEYEAAMELKYAKRDVMKDKLKDYMTAHKLSSLVSESGDFGCKLEIQHRTSFDEDLMRFDGIDVSKYKKTKEVEYFKVKPEKKKEE